MAQATVELKLPPWMEPEALTGFLDELRDSGYNVGTAQYIAAHDLVVALTARGEDLAAPARFRSFLGPLVCRSPREQEEFRTLFDRWVSRFESDIGNEPAVRRASEEEIYGELRKVGKRSRLWMLWTGLLALLLVGFFLYLRSPSSAPVVPPPNVEEAPPPALPAWEVREILAGLFVVLLLTLVAWRQWWRYRAHLFLVRMATTDDPRIERLAVRGLIDELFEKQFLLRTIQGFRQRFEVPSQDLDVEGTIRATMRNGGWFSPVFGRRSITPEYLVLIDRASHRDQQARLIEELVNKLETSHVFVSRWYFDGDPRLCFPSSERELPLTLNELRARYPEHRLLLFSDGSGLFDFGLGELPPWVEQLAQWKQRALLTPRPIEQWRQQELKLRPQLPVLPATAEGLAYLSQIFNSERPHALHTDTAPRLLPEDLRLRPQRWLSRDAPDDRLVERVVGDLEQFLGDAGFYWLSACAVYPALSWDLVLFLGGELRTDKGERLLTAERFAVLGQLPWFRNGYMPDWLRLRLVGALPKEREQAVRDLVTSLLLTTLAGVRHDFHLEIAQRERRTLSRLMRRSLDVLARRSPEESPLKDYVFRDFMAGRKKRRLAIRLPDRITRLFASRELGSALHARVHGTTKVMLLASISFLPTVLSIILLGGEPDLLFLFLSGAAALPLFFLGLTFKNITVGLSGLAGLWPSLNAALANWDRNFVGTNSVSIYASGVLAVILMLRGLCRPQKKMPSLAWRSSLLALVVGLTWGMGFSALAAMISGDRSFAFAVFGWLCLGASLAVLSYVEKFGWLSAAGLAHASCIFVLAHLEASDEISGWTIAIILGTTFATSLGSLRTLLRRSRVPGGIAVERKAAR